MIRGLIKIHKEDSPIRLTVNWKKAPVCKLAKMLSKKLNIHVPLPYTFNAKKNCPFNTWLTWNSLRSKLKFSSFDITNIYSNIPTNELIKTIYVMCDKQSISEELKHEIMKISQIIIKQNYFKFQNELYIQEEGLAMGAPTSSIFSEIYPQHIENTIISDILLRYHIVGYFRYMDAIPIVCNKDTTNI